MHEGSAACAWALGALLTAGQHVPFTCCCSGLPSRPTSFVRLHAEAEVQDAGQALQAEASVNGPKILLSVLQHLCAHNSTLATEAYHTNATTVQPMTQLPPEAQVAAVRDAGPVRHKRQSKYAVLGLERRLADISAQTEAAVLEVRGLAIQT